MAEKKQSPPAEKHLALTDAMAALGDGDGRHIYQATNGSSKSFVIASTPTQALCCVAADDGWTVATVSQKEQLAAARAALAAQPDREEAAK